METARKPQTIFFKFTTVALSDSQYLRRRISVYDTKCECYCVGYDNGKRLPSLDGFYYRMDLHSYKLRKSGKNWTV